MTQFETINRTTFESTVHKDFRLTMPLAKPVDIYLTGLDSSGGHLTIKPSRNQFVDIVRSTTVSANRQCITIKGKSPGWEQLEAIDGSGRVYDMLKIITGELTAHLRHDLLSSQLANSNDSRLLHLLRQILENQAGNTFDQRSPANVARFGSPLACGKVVQANWNDLGFNKVHVDLVAYHEKLASRITSHDQVTYNEATLRLGCKSIERLLSSGTAVLVGIMLDPKAMNVQNGEFVCYHAGGHYALIVGCDSAAERFLYIDPLAGVSSLKYAGGHNEFDSFKDPCKHLGILMYKKDPTNPIPGRRQMIIPSPSTSPYHFEIVRGPR